jgi:MFS family permease
MDHTKEITAHSIAEEKKLRDNLLKVYVYVFFQYFLVIIPVIVPYWQTKGLSLQDIFLLQGIFGAALLIFDVPAGYLGDYLGRKKIMVLGSIVSALAFQMLWFDNTFWGFAIYEMILGLGLSLQSGCDVAILYGSLERLGAKGRPASYLGRRLTALTIGEGIASLIGGFLASFSLDWPAYANAVTAWLPVVIAMTLYEPKGAMLKRGSHKENICAIGRALFGHSRFLTLAIASFIFYGFATYCAIWTFQPYWQARGLNYSWFGYLWAINSFVIAFVGRYAHAIEEKIGSSASIVVIALMPIIGYLGMGYSASLVGLLFGFAFAICRAMNQVLFQDAINTRVPTEMRATTNSIGSLGMRALFLVFGPVIGAILDQHGPNTALKILGLVYVAGFFLITAPLLRQRRHFQT